MYSIAVGVNLAWYGASGTSIAGSAVVPGSSGERTSATAPATRPRQRRARPSVLPDIPTPTELSSTTQVHAPQQVTFTTSCTNRTGGTAAGWLRTFATAPPSLRPEWASPPVATVADQFAIDPHLPSR